jgi:hypothetical protein
MLLVASVLFLVPLSLLLMAWRHTIKSRPEAATAGWRKYCGIAALLDATTAILVSMLFTFSWLNNGGSPHGLDPAPGLWQTLRPLIKWALASSFVLAILGKGKVRLLLLGIAPSVVFVSSVIFMLQMD